MSLHRQISRLAGDLAPCAKAASAQGRALVETQSLPVDAQFILVGDGDSHHAAVAAAMAYEVVGRVRCHAVSSHQLAFYGDCLRQDGYRLERPFVVVGLSASGGTERTLAALDWAHSCGASTVGVTTTPGSAVATRSDHAIVIDLDDLEPGPGTRTFQAGLVGLLGLAYALGEQRGQSSPLDTAVQDLSPSAEVPDAVGDKALADAADTVADAAYTSVVGGGPSLGTALFGAAKLIEAAGVPVHAQDVEEWWHVERFMRPADQALIVVDPGGRSWPRARQLIEQAARLGRRVIAVVSAPAAAELSTDAIVVTVPGPVAEELSPLVLHPPLARLAAVVASRLGRVPFAAGEAGFRIEK